MARLTMSHSAAKAFCTAVGNAVFEPKGFVNYLMGMPGKVQDLVLDLFMEYVDALAYGFDEGLHNNEPDKLNRMASAKRMQDAMVHFRR